MRIKRICLTFFLMFVLASSVYADMGPKPSVTLKFRGYNYGDFYVTLLSETKSNGPWNKVEIDVDAPEGEDYTEEYIDAWWAFARFNDEDDYCFWGYLDKPEKGTDFEGDYLQFSWDYFPPENFKVLLYFPHTGQCYVCDEKMETYAFHSQYEVTHSEPDEFRIYIDRAYGYGWEVFAFLVRFGLTVGFEVLVALAFGFKQKRQLQVILLANLVTQLALNLGLLTHDYPTIFFFYVVEYFIWEALIFASEAITYKLTLHRFEEPYQTKKRPVLYALTANVVSFVMGYVIWQWFPNVF